MTLDRASGRPLSLCRATRPDTTGRRSNRGRATRAASDIRAGMKLRWAGGRRMGYGSDYGSTPGPADLPLTGPHATCSPMHATSPSRPPAPTVAAGPA